MQSLIDHQSEHNPGEMFAIAGLLLAHGIPDCSDVAMFAREQTGPLSTFNPSLRFEHHTFHEVAIAVALAQSGFVTWVTWRCFLRSGEVFLRWLTIGFLAFTIIYAMHGILTRASHELMKHFIIFGPASRFAMAACFLIGIVSYGQSVVPVEQRIRPELWLRWIGAFVSITILVYLMAGTAWVSGLRVTLETASLVVMLASLVVIVIRRPRSPLILIFALSLLFFAQSSVAFLIGSVWNHQWWLAHAIFAAGFIGLSYGVIQAFLTTGSFSTVYSQADLMKNIRAEKARADEALLELNRPGSRPVNWLSACARSLRPSSSRSTRLS